MGNGNKTFELQEVFYGQSGSIYYRHVDIGQFPVERQIYLSQTINSIKYGLSDEYLDEFEDKMGKALGKGDVGSAMVELQDMSIRRKRCPSLKLFLSAANLMFYRHDENPYTYNPLTLAKKLNEVKEDDELRSFFIITAWDALKAELSEERLGGLKTLNGLDFLTSQLEKIRKEMGIM